MVALTHMVGRLRPAKILVVGDMIVDTYTIGKASRISPEAPVAVVNVQQQEHRPGGAGNVILNLLSLGAEVIAAGRVGNDWEGRLFVETLQREGVDIRMILHQEGYPTAVKHRVVADGQQMVRIDREEVAPLPPHGEQEILHSLPSLLEGVQAVAISDYGKGFLTPGLLASLIRLANERHIPVITDPKGHDFTKYRGTTVIKPNLGEAFVAASLPRTAPLDEVASRILQQTGARLLMVTRSEAGISLFHDTGARSDFPVHAKQVRDVTGAGDTVLAVLAYAMANALAYGEAAQLCNVAAGIAIERLGCARVSLSDLALQVFEEKARHKVFDEDHFFILETLLKHKSFIIIDFSRVEHLSPALFYVIKEKAAEAESLLVLMEGARPDEGLVEMLASFQEISFILVHAESVARLCRKTMPLAAYVFDPVAARLTPLEFV